MEETLPETQPKSFIDSARNVLNTARNKISSSLSSTPEVSQSIDINKDISHDMNSYSNVTPVENKMKFKEIAIYGGTIIILMILGVNIFYYLGNFTEILSSIFKTIMTFFGLGAANEVKKNVDVTTNNVNSGLNKLDDTIQKKKTRNKIDIKKKNNVEDSDDEDELITTAPKKASTNASTNKPTSTNAPNPDDATSSTQRKNTKPSYCYIGETDGVRSCTSVKNDIECMSGEIFPTMDICVNPNLRY